MLDFKIAFIVHKGLTILEFTANLPDFEERVEDPIEEQFKHFLDRSFNEGIHQPSHYLE